MFEDVRQGKDPNDKPKDKAHTLKSFLDTVYEPWMTAEYKTRVGQVARIRSTFKGMLAMRLDKLDAGRVEKWRTKRLEKVKQSTANRDLAAFKAVLARALEWGYLTQHPFGTSKVRRRPEEDSAAARYLEEDEEIRLFAALEERAQRVGSSGTPRTPGAANARIRNFPAFGLCGSLTTSRS